MAYVLNNPRPPIPEGVSDDRGAGKDLVSRACMKPQKKAFTLIETLVTLGILAIVFGMLLPAIRGVRESAKLREIEAGQRDAYLALTEIGRASCRERV